MCKLNHIILVSAATAPTSFEGSYGRIIYRVRAFIDTPRFAKDYNAEKPFYLLRLLNLNEVPDIWVTHSNLFLVFDAVDHFSTKRINKKNMD